MPFFSGGGSRYFWQLGCWDGANDGGLGSNETVDYAVGTRAGCALATAAFPNRGLEALDLFKTLTSANPSNIHWHNFSGESAIKRHIVRKKTGHAVATSGDERLKCALL